MELDRLIDALSDPAAYPEGASAVEVRHTHISAVFLVGRYVYKVKKPVDLGFLDFSTLDKRRHFCHEELRLNRRLAPDVYLDVVPIVPDGARVKVAGQGPAIEWAVKMRRLSDDATLEHRLEHGQADRAVFEALAKKLAMFHAQAERGEHIARFGRFEVVERNALENLEQAATQIGTTLSREVHERLSGLTAMALAANRATIDSRAARGVPCDTHGYLRLGHVYHFPNQPPPNDLVVIDCIEFSDRFRFADPVADMAFLAMGLIRAGHAELAAAFSDAYFHAAGDEEGRGLLPLYVSYRAAVRGKVDGIQAARAEIPNDDRQIALSKARGFWLLALGALEKAVKRPCLVLVGGLPGTGKSTLAAGLANQGGFTVIRSDVVRKELAEARPAASQPIAFGEGLYTDEWNRRTYAECLRRTETLLFAGQRVIIDASFRSEADRQTFLAAAVHWGVPGLLFVCRADRDVIRRRLAERTGDVSDADWSIYEQAAKRWEPPGPLAQGMLTSVDTSVGREHSLQHALAALRQRELVAASIP